MSHHEEATRSNCFNQFAGVIPVGDFVSIFSTTFTAQWMRRGEFFIRSAGIQSGRGSHLPRGSFGKQAMAPCPALKEQRKLASYEVAGNATANHRVLKGRWKTPFDSAVPRGTIYFMRDPSHFVAG
jgi:hypothetical protein